MRIYLTRFDGCEDPPVVDTGDAAVVITDAFVGPIIRTAEGHEYGICLRDDTIEVTPVGDAPAPRLWANEPAGATS